LRVIKTTKPFYRTAAWQKCRAFILARDNYLCQKCLRKGKIAPADMVHHIKALDDCPALALTPENLTSLCNMCHEQEHKRWQKKKKKAIRNKRKARVIVSRANPEIPPPALQNKGICL